MKSPKVSIIILNYNGLKFLDICLNSIKKQTYKNIETIVVDNGSTDNSVAFLTNITGLNLITNQNVGYAAGMNLGAKKATGDFLIFLNNDTELFEDFVQRLFDCYKSKTIVVPRQILMDQPDSEGFAGNGIDIFGYPYSGKNQKATKIFYADGAAIFLKRQDFLSIGMFDEKLFMFQEDVDFSWRARLLGFAIVPCLTAKFYHFSGGTAEGGALKEGQQHKTSYFRRYHVEKNTLRNILKNYGSFLVLPVVLLFLLASMAEMFFLLLLGKTNLAMCYVRAYKWNIRHFKDTLAMRQKIQSTRKTSDLEIIKMVHFGFSKLTAFFRVGGFPKFS